MPSNITLKNIPDDIYARLKESADVHHRSINSEIIACLEKALLPAKISGEERLARARKLRQALEGRAYTAAEISDAIRQGRP